MKTKLSLIEELRLGTATALIFAMGLAGTGSAMAQDQDEEEELLDEEEVEEVVVTGSRIRRTGLETVEPAVILDQELLQQRAFTNLADLLNEVPSFGAPAADPIGTQNGTAVGQNVVDFLGLGSQRTLTLVNGRRYVSSNPPGAGISDGLQVDFNTIPVALVERIDIIATAGAPTYGSDAIAGTINVILRDDFEGVNFTGQYSVTEKGDSETYQVQAVMGGNFADDRGNAVISFEYNEQAGLAPAYFTRPFFGRNEPFISEVPAGTAGFDDLDGDGDGSPDRIFRIFNANGTDGESLVQIVSTNGIISPFNFLLPAQGVGSLPDGNFYEFNGNGELVVHTPGTAIPGTSAFFAQGGDGYDLFDRVNTLVAPLTRFNFAGLSTYELNDYVTLFGEFAFSNSKASEFANQAGFQSFAFGDSSDGLTFSVDHPLLTDQARGVLTSNGLSTFSIQRMLNDILSDGELSAENSLWRAVGGARGEFEFAERNFYWEASVNFGQADVNTLNEEGLIDEAYFNALDAVALTQEDIDTLGADLEGQTIIRNGEAITLGGGNNPQVGDAICSVSLLQAQGEDLSQAGFGTSVGDNPYVDGCVPLDIFGDSRAAQAALDFVTASQVASSDINQAIYSVNFGGDIMELPGGTWSFFSGYETRREEGSFNPGGFSERGFGRFSPSGATGGSFETDEVYVETYIPILNEDIVSFVNEFSVEAKFRYVDNTLAGADETWSVGTRLAVFDMVTFNGSYTEAIRSPSIGELFQPTVQTFGFVADPCDFRNIDEGPDPATRRANCIADGIADPDNFVSNAVNASILGTSSGNPDLINESSKAFALGLAITPDKYVPGLQIRADYISVDIEDRISFLSASTQSEACYDSPDFPNVAACDAITRASNGQIVTFRSSQQNAASSEFQGVFLDVRYDFQLADAFALFDESFGTEDMGEFRFRANVFRRIQNDLTIVGPTPPTNIGEFGTNRWQATYDFTYDYKDLQLFWRINWNDNSLLDAAEENYFANEDGELINSTGARAIHNLSVNYQITENVQVRANVNNVMGRKGNLLQRAYGDIGISEILGRTFALTLRANF